MKKIKITNEILSHEDFKKIQTILSENGINTFVMPSNEGVRFNNLPNQNRFSENVKWNIKNRITRKIGIPAHLLVSTLSILSDLDNLVVSLASSSLFPFL